MLYQIDQKTWLDLPQWKCREEFAELFRCKRQPNPDPDRLAELKALCDRITEEHANGKKQRMPRKPKRPHKPYKKGGGRKGRPIDMYDLDGKYIKTFKSAVEAAAEIAGNENPIYVANGINQTVRRGYGSAYGYMFRKYVEYPHDIEPYASNTKPSMPVVVTYADGKDREFESLSDAARFFGLSKETVHGAANTGRVIQKCGIMVRRLER